MVSMKDIARRCNVSVATVSKALNGYSDIGKAKREEIQEAAKEMGYFPNSSARALKTNRTYDLGILFSDNLNSGLTHDYFAAILDSFKVTAEEKGYDITFTSMGMVANRRMSYYEHCRYRGLDGVVIANIDYTTPEVMELVRSSLPVVTVDFTFDGRIAIVSDNVRGMRELVDHVCAKGHRKIAYIHGDDNAVTRDRVSSFQRALDRHGIRVPDQYLIPCRYRDIKGTEQATEQILKLPDLPTCIFFPDDYSTVGGLSALRKAGLRIPDDISIVGYDGIPMAAAMDPSLTTMRQDTRTVGRRAAEELISLIENPRTTQVRKYLVGGELVEGSSVRQMA